MLRRILPLLFAISFHLSGFGQDLHYQSFSNMNLGPEASVAGSFIQDSEGMIWVGTDKGLFSYDGYSFQPHFTFGQRDNSRIYCGLTIGDQYLYVGSDNGLLIYNYHTDRYEDPHTTFPKDIRAMICCNDVLWIGTLNGLYTYHFSSKKLQRIHKKEHPGFTHETIYSLIQGTDNQVYIGTYNGLCRYLSESGTFETIPLPEMTHKSNLLVNSLLEDAERNCIWIGTEGNLYRYDLASRQTRQVGGGFHDNSVKSLALDQNHNLLMGTDNGLYIYQEDGMFRHVVHDSRNVSSLANNIIWNIFTDREKNIWLGTEYGISLSRFNSGFRYIPISRITGTGDGNHFYSLYKDSRNNFWFGGTNGIIRFNDPMGSNHHAIWYRIDNKQYPLSHNRVRHIYEDKQHRLWIATDGSINRYDYSTGQFVHYNIVDSTGTFNSNWAYHIFEDHDEQLWIATCLGGIFVVNKQKLLESRTGNYTAEYNFSDRNGLSGMFVNQIVPDREGNVWVLLYNNGIDKINIETRQITKVIIGHSINEKSLNYLLCDQSGTIWAGFISDILHMHYRCRIAENGKSGKELCMELLPDLIISDILMPVMNGLEMCRQIKKNMPTSTIPIILLTAQSDKDTELESMQINVDAFISKPFEPDMLISRIEQLLSSKQQQEIKARMEVIATPKAIEAISYDEKFLSHIIRIIEDHISDSELNVNALCELSGVNNKQIYRKIKQLTGMTPVEYIKTIRMKKAAMLLNQKKFSVAEIMYMVGYSNHSYFSKCFQLEFGKTPKRYMEESE